MQRLAILITLIILITGLLGGGCGAEHERARAPEPETPVFATGAQHLTREGEILVVEGGLDTVTQVGPDQFSLLDENLQAILAEVYAEVPDVFDTVFVFTTFTDQERVGIAQTININNEVQGIGLEVLNNREVFGLPRNGGRLSSLSLMNSLRMWGNGSLAGLDAEGGFFRGVMAEELSRRWLFHARFSDLTGNSSEALLGRATRNWSRLAQADGSFLDGNRWVDNGDDTFTNTGSNLGFAPLDLYLMGLGTAEAVPPFFYIAEATTMNGDPLDSTSLIPDDATINGARVDVTIDQVLEALGPRLPPPLTRIPYDRAIVVLVTAPGQVRADWAAELQVLQSLAAGFPQSWTQWTGGALCTQSTERCAEPVIGLSDFEFSDGNDDVVGPGESTNLTLTIQNGGLGTAEDVQVELRPVGTAVQVDTSVLTAPAVPSGGRVTLSSAFALTVSSTVGCGDRLKFDVVFTTAEGPQFEDRFEIEVGSREVAFDPLNEDVFWTVDPDGSDTAVAGQWELGDPEQVVAPGGDLTQPEEDRTTGEGRLAFVTGARRAIGDSTLFTSNDLDRGRTTVESPIFAIGSALDPSLVFYAWRFGRNYLAPGGAADLEASDLIVEVSNDGGMTYVPLGRFSENTTEWTRVSFRIRDAIEPSNRMRFRFIAEEEEIDMPIDIVVEMGIDDIQLVDTLPECSTGPVPMPDAGMMAPTVDSGLPIDPDDGDGDDGCGCTTSPRASDASSLMGLALLALLFARRRRHHG